MIRNNKKKEFKGEKELNKKHKILDEDFEQNHFSTTTKSIHESELDSIRVDKRMAFCYRYYEEILKI